MPRKGTKAPRVFIIGKEVLARRTRSSMKQELREVVFASDDDSTHVPADASLLSIPDLIDVEEQSLNSSFGEQSMLIDDETIPLHKRKAGKRSRVLSDDDVNAEAAMDISLAASSTNQDEPDEGDIADSPRGKRLRPQRAAKLPENRQRHMSSNAHADERFASTPPKSQRSDERIAVPERIAVARTANARA